jgi:hypothetical protein
VNGVPDDMANFVTIDGSSGECGSGTTETACMKRQSKTIAKVPEAILKSGVDKCEILVRVGERVCMIEKFDLVCAIQCRLAEVVAVLSLFLASDKACGKGYVGKFEKL